MKVKVDIKRNWKEVRKKAAEEGTKESYCSENKSFSRARVWKQKRHLLEKVHIWDTGYCRNESESSKAKWMHTEVTAYMCRSREKK